MIKKSNKSILKWPGGKERELSIIFSSLPSRIKNYYEPFVGGGAVFTSIEADKYFINDKSDDLALLYRIIKNDIEREEFIKLLKKIDKSWSSLSLFSKENSYIFLKIYNDYKESQNREKLILSVSSSFIDHKDYFLGLFPKPFNFEFKELNNELNKNMVRKLVRMFSIESKKGQLSKEDLIHNIESALKSAFYMQMRYFLNNTHKLKFSNNEKTAIFFFIRNYTYSGMFRYNKNGDFNVPYGGIGYNNNSLKKRISNFESLDLIKKLRKTKIGNKDFYDFMKANPPKKDDFIFLDPPYDTDFSTYSKNEFQRQDQERLANYLINETKSNWMLIIKNTDFIYDLYNKDGVFISTFDKTYQVSFMNRNDRNTEHLLITNYSL